MDNKDIAINVIVQDMRFNQYLSVLRKLGIEANNFEIELIGIVAKLMGKEEGDISDSWMELYFTELSKCESVPIEPLGKNLYSLAEECYGILNGNKKVDGVQS